MPAKSSSHSEVGKILDEPLGRFKAGCSVSSGVLFCSHMKKLESIVMKIEKSIPEGVFALSGFLPGLQKAPVHVLPPVGKVVEVAGSSNAHTSAAVQIVENNLVKAPTSSSSISEPMTSVAPSNGTAASSEAATAVSNCPPPPLSQLERVNGHTEKRAKESALGRDAKKKAIMLHSMFSSKPESNLPKRKLDEAFREVSQLMEKRQKLESKLGLLLQEYRDTREELLRASTEVTEAFKKFADFTEVDMTEYPLM